MSTRLDGNLGAVDYDGLIYSGNPKPDVFSVTVRAVAEETTLKRGTVLALSTEDNKLVVLGTEATGDETLSANCIVSDDTVVGTADATVVAYRTGNFNRNKLIVAEGYALSATDEEDLRKGGIILDTAV